MQFENTETIEFGAGWDRTEVVRTLEGVRRAVLVAHTNADGDAVGSLTATASLLRRAVGAEVVMMLPDGCPDDLAWLPSTDAILCGRSQAGQCQKAVDAADIIICLDVSSLDRTGCLAAMLGEAKAAKMLVDHHIDPDRDSFDLVVSEPDISSTCELVYWLMHTCFGDDCFTAESATSLFTGICTDTGTFSYSNDRPSVYHAAAALLRFGIDPMDINRRIKNVFSVARLQFFGFAVAHRLEVYEEQGVALMTLSARDMEEHGVCSHELTGLINEVMRLKDVDCGILVREEEGQVRLSLRSKTRYDVNLMARELFGGGGHERAAGATSHLSLADTVVRVRKHLGLCMLALLAMVATACREVPVIEQPEEGNTQMREIVINANRHVAHSEEQQIASYLERRGWHADTLQGGVRVVETRAGLGSGIMPDDTLHIKYRLETIGGDIVYTERTETVVAGRQQPTAGLDAALARLHRGSEATVLVPSALGYGVAGDGDRIASRMVLVYKLKIED